MDKIECLAVVELLSVSWDKPIEKNTLKIRASGYWEYINDLPASAVTKVIKDMAISGKTWAPKPGELRVATIVMMENSKLPPAPETAWTELQNIRTAVYAGTTNYKKADPVLAATMKALGGRATDLTTNGDRDMFIRLYSQERERYLLENYRQPDE